MTVPTCEVVLTCVVRGTCVVPSHLRDDCSHLRGGILTCVVRGTCVVYRVICVMTASHLSGETLMMHGPVWSLLPHLLLLLCRCESLFLLFLLHM